MDWDPNVGRNAFQRTGGRAEGTRNAEDGRQNPCGHIRETEREPDGPKLQREVVARSWRLEF